jgi:hypothetical protein
VAEHLKKFWPPEDSMDNGDIGDALKLFSQCSIDSVIRHLASLVISHPIQDVRQRIEDYIEYLMNEHGT